MWFLVYKLVRPILPLSSGVAAWIISQACGASIEQSLAAAVSIALSTIGASLYHHGGANWMYTRKDDRLELKNPELVRLIGLGIFCLSIGVAVWYLPKECVLICLFNTFVIAAYTAVLSSKWATKNITMSIICTTPIVIGWYAGDTTHPIVFWAIGIASVAHLSREMIKDVKDIIANGGVRVTIPMLIGKENTLRISGALLILVTALPFALLQFTDNSLQAILAIFSSVTFLATGILLITSKKPSRCETLIHVSLSLTLLALL